MDLFASLVDRALGRVPVLQRRRPTVFEPAKNAVLTTHDNTMDLLREEQSYAEAEGPAPRETSKVVDHGSDESRTEVQAQRADAASTVTPRATDITIVEEQPAFKTSERKPTESDLDNSSIHEQNLTQESPQQLSKPTTPALAPALDTIVESKPETQIVLQKPENVRPFDEIDLVAEAPDDAQSSIVNNIVVLRSIAQKQNAEHIDETRLLKPVAQRRPTRQQMQRSTRARSQPVNEQLDTAATPTINVTIGRVEVRASAPAKRAESARQAGPKLSLDEYLRGRSRGNR